jgi:hypothetical protein
MKMTKAAQAYLRKLDFKLHEARLSLKRGGHSSLGEERLLRKYIGELLPSHHSRAVVDLGAGDGTRWSNTYALFRDGWRGVGVEYDSRKAVGLARNYKYYKDAYACRCRVTPDNVIPLLQAYAIEKDFSVLSLDIDSYDYRVLDRVLQHYRPRIIITEINEKIPPPIKFVVNYDPDFELRHHFYGYSIESLAELCERHGYALIQLEYNNAFLAPLELQGVRPLAADIAYRQGYLERPDRREKFRLNYDMEALHSLSPQEGVEFIKQFYARFAGKYEVSVAEVARVETSRR